MKLEWLVLGVIAGNGTYAEKHRVEVLYANRDELK